MQGPSRLLVLLCRQLCEEPVAAMKMIAAGCCWHGTLVGCGQDGEPVSWLVFEAGCDGSGLKQPR